MQATQVELEICANCKREIPHTNYVMHTAHCARNISLCSICKEPIPKTDIETHQKTCIPPKPIKIEPPTKLEQSSYFKSRKEVEDKKVTVRQAKRLEKLERLVNNGSGNTIGHVSVKQPPVSAPSKSFPTLPSSKSFSTSSPSKPFPTSPPSIATTTTTKLPSYNYDTPIGSSKSSSLLPCQYCELELPKFDLDDHETYCGARTEKCEECGDMVMFKDRNAHRDSNHYQRNRPKPTPSPRESRRLSGATSLSNTEKLESSREISRRLDCKTEYIRNLLHDSASITAPIRSTGAIPRNKGTSGSMRRRNPPTEMLIPCEFCNIPIPHEDLIQHETGCRPDLARYNPRRRDLSPEPEQYPSREPTSPDVDIPCEYCSDLIPASQFLNHQATCSCN